jgi:type II secretory pathway pseudopilin PulG
VIIGILAAVAIPRMMAAADRARAAEGPQILGVIVNMQHAFRAEQSWFVICDITTAGDAGGLATGGWAALGFDQDPQSRFYTFEVGVAGAGPAAGQVPQLQIPLAAGQFGSTFDATATLAVGIGQAVVGNSISVDNLNVRTRDGDHLANLLPNFRVQ